MTMTNKVTHAPQHVIDDLNKWAEDPRAEASIQVLLTDIMDARDIFRTEDAIISDHTARWVYGDRRLASDDLPYEQAVIEHVFGDTRLEAEDGK